jgi:hypothetical protein
MGRKAVEHIIVRNDLGDVRSLISWESDSPAGSQPATIITNEYGTFVEKSESDGAYLINGVRYLEVSKTPIW